jgi:two-component system OmpR family sensor kinase
MRHRHRTLRSRLFVSFVGAILLAMATSALVVVTTRPEPIVGAEAVARNVGNHLAGTWDDADATRAYLNEVRDVTGFDVRLVRDAHRLPGHVRRTADRGGTIAPDGPFHIFVPVVRSGELVGALEMERFGPRPLAWGWWRFALALSLVLVVLSAMAGRVGNQIALPLERLAHAADRFGGGDLTSRTEVADSRRRWIAREVREVAVSFNRMADRVEAMVRGQRELLGAISHELRSPLGRARVALEIARDRLPPEAGGRSPREALDDVETQLGAVDSVLGDLLDVTRTGLADLHREKRGLVAWIRGKIAEEPQPPAIVLLAPDGGEDPSFPFDPLLLARVVHNLLVNARAYGHPIDSPIDVHVSFVAGERDRGRWARVVVRDRGSGFPDGFAERAFEPFVRGDPSRARPTDSAGYGLGLAIVKRIVEAHGGRVFAGNVASGAGPAGAEVGFELPLASATR